MCLYTILSFIDQTEVCCLEMFCRRSLNRGVLPGNILQKKPQKRCAAWKCSAEEASTEVCCLEMFCRRTLNRGVLPGNVLQKNRGVLPGNVLQKNPQLLVAF
jgi:hypothetical protein